MPGHTDKDDDDDEGGVFDEIRSWAKWRLYDAIFAVALFVVLKRFRFLVPTARLLQLL